MDQEHLRQLSCHVTGMLGERIIDPAAHIDRRWQGHLCQLSISNNGTRALRLKEVVLFSGTHQLPADCPLYGEGYSKLSQYGGTVSQLEDIGAYNDGQHYKMPQSAGRSTVYNLALLSPEQGRHILMAFSSCHRFNGQFRFDATGFEVVLDLEGLEIGPQEQWSLEEFFFAVGPSREGLLQQLAERISVHHPRLPVQEIPSGWCSWYGYGPKITEEIIFENLQLIADEQLPLKYIQIDDGYQAYMGDWLSPGTGFSRDIQTLCQRIAEQGFLPAIWVAPFIAEEKSQLFCQHPDWFVQDARGQPLPSDRISFGGWRRGPWYMLDGTHPGAQEYLRHVFATMRNHWGAPYFKLDANMWGALHGGKRHDPGATRVEAYRRGMAAVLDGAGPGAFILGCNAPMWPSLGLVHGMRVTRDTKRDWPAFSGVARELFFRNWQHGRLWVNDPDCVLLTDKKRSVVDPGGRRTTDTTPLSDNEFLFHATMIFASGGMVLGGDRMPEMDATGLARLKKLLPPIGMAAQFDDTSFQVGRTRTDTGLALSLFNWQDGEKNVQIDLPQGCDVVDVWSGENLGRQRQLLVAISGYSARLLFIRAKKEVLQSEYVTVGTVSGNSIP